MKEKATSRGATESRINGVFILWFVLALSMPSAVADEPVCIIIHGLGGMPEYEENFVQWSERVAKLFEQDLQGTVHRIDGRSQRRDEILQLFNETASSASKESPVWLFLVGHANHDGELFKMHIRGPDLTDQDIQDFFNALGDRKTFLVAATSASGALVDKLGAANRVVVTATKNAYERQPPLFLSFFLEAATSAQADSDKNGKVSLLEAFLFSRSKVAEFFESKGRLQTEHPMLFDAARVRLTASDEEDTEGLSTGTGMLAAAAYVSAPPEQAYRSLESQQLAEERTRVEREIEDLKFRKNEIAADKYYQQLEELLVKLASISEKIAQLEGK